MATLIHELIGETARRLPSAPALRHAGVSLSYGALAAVTEAFAMALLTLDLGRGERVAVYMDKREENVAAMFGAAAAGGVFVPVNPLLKPAQVAHILGDCAARVLVTTHERLQVLRPVLLHCPDLHTVIVTDTQDEQHDAPSQDAGITVLPWSACLRHAQDRQPHRRIDADVAAILYTSGSTGKPKGVVLSHRNLVAGAASVASYLENSASDRILSVLPLSFDYGLSQLTTAFSCGACAVLLNYLLPGDVLTALEAEAITGLAAVPPLWTQLATARWPHAHVLRYATNSGGAMPRALLERLRVRMPDTRIYLMYGLTEAFRSTYLPPEQIDARPDSIGKAIPNAEILVLHPDGSPCAPGEPGELVHRGPLVALGYWNDADKTAQRFRSLPPAAGLPLAETAVWSGDIVRADEDGYLYFLGRRDEMIKTSGYRVSPTEIEEVVIASGLVQEAVAVGLPHPTLGHAVALLAVVLPETGTVAADLGAVCRAQLPGYMVPAWIDVQQHALPRNPNGKIDRRRLQDELAGLFQDAAP